MYNFYNYRLFWDHINLLNLILAVMLTYYLNYDKKNLPAYCGKILCLAWSLVFISLIAPGEFISLQFAHIAIKHNIFCITGFSLLYSLLVAGSISQIKNLNKDLILNSSKEFFSFSCNSIIISSVFAFFFSKTKIQEIIKIYPLDLSSYYNLLLISLISNFKGLLSQHALFRITILIYNLSNLRLFLLFINATMLILTLVVYFFFNRIDSIYYYDFFIINIALFSKIIFFTALFISFVNAVYLKKVKYIFKINFLFGLILFMIAYF